LLHEARVGSIGTPTAPTADASTFSSLQEARGGLATDATSATTPAAAVFTSITAEITAEPLWGARASPNSAASSSSAPIMSRAGAFGDRAGVEAVWTLAIGGSTGTTTGGVEVLQTAVGEGVVGRAGAGEAVATFLPSAMDLGGSRLASILPFFSFSCTMAFSVEEWVGEVAGDEALPIVAAREVLVPLDEVEGEGVLLALLPLLILRAGFTSGDLDWAGGLT
jgi:hypothetical protein